MIQYISWVFIPTGFTGQQAKPYKTLQVKTSTVLFQAEEKTIESSEWLQHHQATGEQWGVSGSPVPTHL